MQLTSAILGAGLLFSTAAEAYVVTIYEDKTCGGAQQDVNIWDNTCGTWMMGFQSLRVKTYGGDGQHLHAYSRNACVAPTVGGYSGAYIDGRQEGAALVKEVRDREDVDAPVLDYPCYELTNGAGGANALGSWSY